MNATQAFAEARRLSALDRDWTDADLRAWRDAERALADAGWCPRCAAEGPRSHLGEHQPATHETYAGRACTVCEEFRPDPGQAATYGAEPDAAGACTSDADPGL